MATRCECCGEPKRFYLGVSTADGEAVQVDMVGFGDELAAVNAALAALRSHKRAIERHQRDNNS